MKSELLFSAAGTIALMLSSCSADEPMAKNTSEGAITYDVIADNQSRAAHSYCNNDKPGEFKIWAKHNPTSGSVAANAYYIDGDNIKKSGNSYTDVDGTRYWPQNGTLSFFAVVDNGNAAIDKTSGKIVVKDYTIEEAAANQLDLMYAVKTTAAPGSDNAPVKLNFRHALSQICFRAKNYNPNAIIKIKSISVNNVYNKGSYTLPETSTEGNYIEHGSTTGTLSEQNNWRNLTGTGSYTISFDSSISINGVGTAIDLTNTGSNGDHTTKWYTNALNLLPQKKNISFTITFNIDNSDGTPTNIDEKKPYTIDVAADWKEGYRYIYTLCFPKDWGQKYGITYEVTADDFKETEFDPYTIIGGHTAVLMRDATDPKGPLYVATTNIGATTPHQPGLYFWWGDISGDDYVVNADGTGYTSFLFYSGNNNITKANNITLNSNNLLTNQNDAAYKHWGEPWRMPTKDEFDWLIKNCNWVWKDDTEKGYMVLSPKTGGSIFLPAAGYIGEYDLSKAQTRRDYNVSGYYWSSSFEPNPTDGAGRNAIRMSFAASRNSNVSNQCNFWGFSIRPVATATATATTTPPTTAS